MSTATPRYRLKSDPYSSHSLILSWLGEGRGRRALDVGAADGLLSARLTAQGWRVTGIEHDPVAAEAGARHCERMVVADLARELPGLDGPFDVIVYGDVLEHLPEPLRVLVELNRWLAPGGFVVISIPNIAHLAIRLLFLAGYFTYMDRGILDRTHLRFFTDHSLRRLLGAAGLVIVRRTATAVPLYQVVPRAWHGWLLDAVHAVSAALSRLFPRLLGYQFVVVAERGTWP